MIRCIVVYVIVGLVAAPLHAQNTTSADTTATEYIEKFHDKYFIWPLVRRRTLSFDIKNRDNKDQAVKYKPNNSYSLGLGVFLFEIAAELSFALPINEKSTNTFGTTDVREFHLNFLGNGWGLNAYSQKYTGFYFPDRSDPAAEVIVKRPDIELTNRGINGIYALNKDKFSLKSAYNYSERQLKSVGSFIITGNLNTFALQADSAIITQSTTQAGSSSDFKLMRNTTLSIAGGYTYTLVYRSFFINGAFSIGPSHNWIYYKPADGLEHYNISINTFNDIRVSVGHNSDRIFGGISLIIQSRNNRFENVDITNTNSMLKFMFGYRFTEVGILKRRAKDYLPVSYKL
jgi:hypothetical protein